MTLDPLTPCEWAIVGHLAKRPWTDAETLNASTADASGRYDHAAPLRKRKTVQVHVFNIREKLGDGAILHMLDRGYMLGAPGVKAWRAKLAAEAVFAEEMRGPGARKEG